LEQSRAHSGSTVPDPKSSVSQQTVSQMPQESEISFDDWMSNIDVNAHHFTTYVIALWCVEAVDCAVQNTSCWNLLLGALGFALYTAVVINIWRLVNSSLSLLYHHKDGTKEFTNVTSTLEVFIK